MKKTEEMEKPKKRESRWEKEEPKKEVKKDPLKPPKPGEKRKSALDEIMEVRQCMVTCLLLTLRYYMHAINIYTKSANKVFFPVDIYLPDIFVYILKGIGILNCCLEILYVDSLLKRSNESLFCFGGECSLRRKRRRKPTGRTTG